MGWVVTGLGKEIRIEEHNKVIRIGRDERCSFALPKEAEGVSRVHAMLTLDKDLSLKLEDTSTYGTEFRGGSIYKTKVSLDSGDKFSIQGREFSVRLVIESRPSSSSRNPKRLLDSVDGGDAKRSKVSSQKKVSDFFARCSPQVLAEDTPVELLHAERKCEDHSIVLESIEPMISYDIPSTSSIVIPTDRTIIPNHLLRGPEQSSISLFESRPVLAADTVNQSFNLNDVNSQILFNPLANSTQNLHSHDVVPLSPESDIPIRSITTSVARSQRDSLNDFLEPSPIPFPQANRKARNKTSIFSSTTTQNSSTVVPSARLLKNNESGVNPVNPPSLLNNMRTEVTGAVNCIPPRAVKKTSIFSNTSNTTIRGVQPKMINTELVENEDIKPVDQKSENASRYSNQPFNLSLPDVKKSVSSGGSSSELQEMVPMVCLQSVEAEGSSTVEEEDKNNQFTKVLKNMEKLVVFADLTRNNMESSRISGLSFNTAASSTIETTKNFKKFKKAKQGKFNPALVTISMNGSEDLIDFRKIQ